MKAETKKSTKSKISVSMDFAVLARLVGDSPFRVSTLVNRILREWYGMDGVVLVAVSKASIPEGMSKTEMSDRIHLMLERAGRKRA
jgi:hypothetical protein